MSKTVPVARVLVLIGCLVSFCTMLGPLRVSAAEKAAVVDKEVAKAMTEAKKAELWALRASNQE